MTDESELLADLRTIRTELFPHRDATHWEPHDDIITLGLYLKREILLARAVKLPSAYAEGAEPQPSAMMKQRPRVK